MTRLTNVKAGRSWAAVGGVLVVIGLVAVLTLHAQARSDEGYLGVYIQEIDEDLAAANDLTSTKGVLITRVVEDSPAEKARLKRGDVVLKFDGKDASSVRRLTRLIDWSEPDSNKDIVIVRDGKEQTVTVVMGEDKGGDFQFFGDPDMNFDFDFDTPTPPDAPTPPRVYGFSTGQLSTSRIGVSLYELSDQLAESYGVEGGALVNQVEKDSPAAKAGLMAGDVIYKMDGKQVDDIDDIRKAIADKDDDETVAVTIKRQGADKSFDVSVETYDTWSGIGAPRMHVQPFQADMHWNWDEDSRRRMRDEMRALRRSWNSEEGQELREELQEALEELREELSDLRKELDDLR